MTRSHTNLKQYIYRSFGISQTENKRQLHKEPLSQTAENSDSIIKAVSNKNMYRETKVKLTTDFLSETTQDNAVTSFGSIRIKMSTQSSIPHENIFRKQRQDFHFWEDGIKVPFPIPSMKYKSPGHKT